MKKYLSRIVVVALLAVSVVSLASMASAEEVKMVGVINKIEMPADGKSATVTLRDNKSGESVAIAITDDLTLDKFKDKRIVEGDEIRCKYDRQDGKNTSKIFKKTAGC
jgi:hypothetical protein